MAKDGHEQKKNLNHLIKWKMGQICNVLILQWQQTRLLAIAIHLYFSEICGN